MNSRFIRGVLLAIALGVSVLRTEAEWLTDYDAALKQASAEGKPVLINFTGSDWCGWCIKLRTEVFDQPGFSEFANANLVLLEVDFPKRKAMSAAQRTANEKLGTRYGIEGFPTVFLANAQGRPIARIDYDGGGAPNFIGTLKRIPGVTWKESEAGASKAKPGARKAPVPDEPLWGGVVFPPKRYDELKLTGLSGSASRRLAIVNNQTFASGESARVKLQGGEVKVLCKEIRAKSVVVQVEGASEAKELFLEVK